MPPSPMASSHLNSLEKSAHTRLLQTAERLSADFEVTLKSLSLSEAERKLLRAMVDQVPDYLFVKDLEGRFVTANKSVATIHGRNDIEALKGLTDRDLHDEGMAEKFRKIEQTIMRSGRSRFDMEEIVKDQHGRRRHLLTTKVPLRDESGKIIGLVGISRDITSRAEAERFRSGQAAVLEMIATNMSLSDVLEQIVELIEGQFEDGAVSILLLDEATGTLRHGSAPSLPPDYCRAVDGAKIGEKAGSCGTAAFRKRPVIVIDIATDPLWEDYRALALGHGLCACWSTPILAHDGHVFGTFAIYPSTPRAPSEHERALTEAATKLAAIAIQSQRHEDTIQYLARHDTLTGLPNRAVLLDRLDRSILRSASDGTSVSVVFVDIDHFKTVNDSLGHATGDLVLKSVADHISKCLRQTDTVIRLGGDEFVITLDTNDANDAEISAALDRLKLAIAQPITVADKIVHVTASIGVATFPHDGRDPGTLIMNADSAMYRAKESGRDTVSYYTPELNRKAQERLAVQEAIRLGIGRSEFYLLFQPQVDLGSEKLVGVEALLRWDHPTRGAVTPAEFIPIAEETGLIGALGDWALLQACGQAKVWSDIGKPIILSVNVSPRQLLKADWVGKVKTALSSTGLDPRYLELEVTENLLMRDIDQAIKTMNELRSYGVRFAIDDFGTGYSSLSALKNLPVSKLKIDQSFVSNIENDGDDRKIAATIISLGHQLEMSVLAEGVENKHQVQILRSLHCDAIQGYVYSKPVEATKISAFLS